ncbi:MAG: pesticin C-terminus-like muramidase [Pseudomonadota bacterium]
MTLRTNTERLRAIQRTLRVEPDGVLGPDTLTAIEQFLELQQQASQAHTQGAQLGLRLSKPGINAIVRYEIGSDSYYQRRLRHPIWPGGDSGITIGVGYDLGFQTREDFRRDWADGLPSATADRLELACGRKGRRAKNSVHEFRDISISLNRARRVFARTSLPTYAAKTQDAYPGMKNLEPDAQSALVSLVYNRGASMRNLDSRREMRDIRVHVLDEDYAAIAGSIRSMKRIWAGRNLDGLLKRRDAEAAMVEGAKRPYDANEVVTL